MDQLIFSELYMPFVLYVYVSKCFLPVTFVLFPFGSSIIQRERESSVCFICGLDLILAYSLALYPRLFLSRAQLTIYYYIVDSFIFLHAQLHNACASRTSSYYRALYFIHGVSDIFSMQRRCSFIIIIIIIIIIYV